MRSTVIWDPPALNELTEIWMQAPDRQLVTAAADLIDRELAVDADLKGIDFYGQMLLAIEPLCVVYTVHPDDCLVRIRLVWSRGQT